MLGTITKLQVKRNRPNKSYGFISDNDGESYYFSIKNVIGEIKLGDVVSFMGEENDKGKCATQVRRLDM